MKYDILVIGDTHIHEDDKLLRFYALRHWAKKRKFKKIIQLGDFGDYAWMEQWNKGQIEKNVFNTRRRRSFMLKNKALDILEKLADEKHLLFGNHESFYTDYLDGLKVDFTEEAAIEVLLKLKERGFSWTPYKQELLINGVSFMHAPLNSQGRPLAGENIAHKALQHYANSIVFGHYHRENSQTLKRHNSDLIYATCAGCFVEKNADYLEGGNVNHWHGVYVFHFNTNRPGTYTKSNFSLEDMLEEYEIFLKKNPDDYPAKEFERDNKFDLKNIEHLPESLRRDLLDFWNK